MHLKGVHPQLMSEFRRGLLSATRLVTHSSLRRPLCSTQDRGDDV